MAAGRIETWTRNGTDLIRAGRTTRTTPETPVISGFAPGAATVGTTNYTIPSGTVLYVSPSGADSNTGTLASPYATIKKAASVATANSAIVVQAGTYHEGGLYPALGDGIGFANNGVTVQAYPGHAVWLDGSNVLTGWTQDGTVWRAPFAQTLDRAPTQTRGETSSSYGSFLAAEFPIAHWPELLLRDGVPLTQVDALSKVTTSTFFVEGSKPNSSGTNQNAFTSTAYVIGFNPAGSEMRVGTLARAMSIGKTSITVKGIGFRRYVPSLTDFGCIYTDGSDLNLEHIVVEDVSTLGIAMNSARGHLNRVTIRRCGQEGLGGQNCDDAILENSLLQQNINTRFAYGPDAGALKWTRCQRPIVRFNWFDTNYGHSIWLDESVYQGVIHGNLLTGNYGKGIAYEIGDSGLIVDNLIIDNGIASDQAAYKPNDCSPIWISGSNRCRVWHNTMINCEKAIAIAQDDRRPLNSAGDTWTDFGQDKRQPMSFYQTDMTWVVTSGQIENNVMVKMAGISQVQSCFMSFYDVSFIKSTVQFGYTVAGNLYTRPDSTHPARFVIGYPGNSSTPVVYYDRTGNTPYNDTVSWVTRMTDAGSVFSQNVDPMINTSKGQVSTTYLNQVTPATVPSDVAALLAVSPFTAQRVGAGYR